MWRSFKTIYAILFSKSMILVPKSILCFKNWYTFLLDYSGFRTGRSIYKMRDGTIIKTPDSVGSATVGVVYLKKEYGNVCNRSLVIDIGANIGVFAIYSAKQCNNTVYCYEPSKENFKYLLDNIKKNHLQSKIFPFNCAVGGNIGKVNLNIHDASPYHSLFKSTNINKHYQQTGIQEETEMITLRDIFDKNDIDKCTFLKIDCEGSEYEIIYNLPEEYLRKIDIMAIESHEIISDNNTYNYKSLIDYLSRRDFEIEDLLYGSFRAVNRRF